MNSSNTTTGNPEERVEQTSEKIDLKSKLRAFIRERTYEERTFFEEARWQDPDKSWVETDKKWEVGFLQYMSQRVQKSGEFDASVFQEYLKKLQRKYDHVSSSEEPEEKKFLKAQLEIAKKVLGLYTPEQGSESQKKNQKERIKGVYSWGNIKFTLSNIRRQIFELFLGKGKDPFFDYSQLDKGMTQIEKSVGMNSSTPAQKNSEQPAVEKPHAEQVPPKTIYDEFLAKRDAKNGNGTAPPVTAPANDVDPAPAAHASSAEPAQSASNDSKEIEKAA
jgi:hypothetical protein